MAVVYILDQVTSRSPVLMLYLRQLWEKLQQSDISFGKIEYIRSAENPADAPSRLKGWDEWRLCQALFDKVSADCGPYTVDRFASAHTALLPRYNSMWADPAAEGLVNAFSNDWRGGTKLDSSSDRLVGRRVSETSRGAMLRDSRSATLAGTELASRPEGALRAYAGVWYLAIGAGLLRACVIPNKRRRRSVRR